MNLGQLKNIINEYKDKFNLNSTNPSKFKSNQILFKNISPLGLKLKEIFYLIKNYNNLENLHIFCNCGNKNNFIDSVLGYSKHCSNKCANNDNESKSKREQTFLKKYGVNNPRKNKNIIEKIKQSKLNNIDENGLDSYKRTEIKRKQTCLKKYGNENYNNKEKIVQTRLNDIVNNKNSYKRSSAKGIQTKWSNIDKNGLNIFQRAVIKMNQTKLNNIDENGFNSYQRGILKQKQTKLKKYDDENYTNTEKIKQTCLKHFGVDNYRKSQEFKDYMRLHQNEIQNKIYQTKKKNNSFNTSEDEEEIYRLLLTKFSVNDILRQYKNKLYPFHCDFYIKSLDLYIEYHGIWTHGNRPFKNSIKDIEQLNKWKNKNSKFYNNAINVWTKSDPLKLETFKKNKLNYKVFYNLDQFNNWFSKIHK